MPTFTYHANGTAHTVVLTPQGHDRYTAQLGERTVTFRAERLPDGGYRLHVEGAPGAPSVVHVAANGAERLAQHAGQVYSLTVPTRGWRAAGAANDGDLTAQMPGQVTAVHVAAGDAVTRGQPLVTLEAMKMQLRVAAPADGVVARVLVAVGQTVERGARLVELDKGDPTDA